MLRHTRPPPHHSGARAAAPHQPQPQAQRRRRRHARAPSAPARQRTVTCRTPQPGLSPPPPPPPPSARPPRCRRAAHAAAVVTRVGVRVHSAARVASTASCVRALGAASPRITRGLRARRGRAQLARPLMRSDLSGAEKRGPLQICENVARMTGVFAFTKTFQKPLNAVMRCNRTYVCFPDP